MIDHLDDLESDFSAIHRVDDVQALDGPRFFRLAWRISTYPGVMQMRVEAHAARDETVTGSVEPANRRSGEGGAAAEVVPLSAFLLRFPDIADVKRAAAPEGGGG